MPIAQALADFNAAVAQCDGLIANAHKADADGDHFMTEVDRQQVTVAGFLNLFIAWETFLETTLAALLIGEPTIGGAQPIKYASPADADSAKEMVIGVNTYFDYGQHSRVTRIASIYLQDGEPLRSHINAIHSDLDDMRTMRHASAHMSSTTQTALEGLALRLLNQPSIGITLYQLLTAADPNTPGQTIFESYKAKLVVTAGLIAQG